MVLALQRAVRTRSPILALWAALVVSATGCNSGNSLIDATAFGGGGRLDAARRKLVNAIARYKSSGVPGTFARSSVVCLTCGLS